MSEALSRHPTDTGRHASSAGAGSNGKAAASAAQAEEDMSIPESLLAAKTTQEADGILKALDTADGPPLEALLSRSSSSGRSRGAPVSAGGVSAGGVSSLGGASFATTHTSGSSTTDKVLADIECYKKQIADLQKQLQQKDSMPQSPTAQASGRNSTGAQQASSVAPQQLVMQLQAELAAAQADKAAACIAQQELQQQKEQAEAAQQQQLLQVNVLERDAAELKQLAAQLQEAQAAQDFLVIRSEALQQELDAARQQLEAIEEEKLALQQQASRVAALEAQVEQLQQQLQQLMSEKADAATDARMLGGKDAGSSKLNTADSTAAVSAVRAATHNLLLQSNPFEVR